MTHHPPRIDVAAKAAATHLLSVVDSDATPLSTLPDGVGVLEVWAAVLPAGTPLDRAYAVFGWMRPTTTFPLAIFVPEVLAERQHLNRCSIIYKARWALDGVPLSPWSNIVITPVTPARFASDQDTLTA